ncbi:hypothetical protein [Paracoccus beibuensis]|uniref:hypothetical protein n=1 Tax=Paracoccus beibuensis TaxID=547602 RepID=UPI0022402583|nr:hypothetical protein [Paracoccus beibuensis]
MMEPASRERWLQNEMERDAKKHFDLGKEIDRLEIIQVGFIFATCLIFVLYRISAEYYDIQIIVSSVAIGVCAPKVFSCIGLRKQ